MQPPPSLNRAVPRSGSSPEISLLPPSIGQARAAGAPPKAASSLSLSSSPAQRELPPNAAGLLPLSIEQPRAAGAPSPQSSLLTLSIEQPRAARAPPKRSLLPPCSDLLLAAALTQEATSAVAEP